MFCVNNGKCKEENVWEGCDCDSTGFTGFSCEFRSASAPEITEPTEEVPTANTETNTNNTPSPTPDTAGADDADYVSCSAQCLNGGTCNKGAKNHGILENIEIKDLNQTSNMDFEHCVCRPGFAGVHCEIKVDVCGEGEHVCLHGSKCVSDGEYHACDCSSADQGEESEAYAGRSCEHKSTDICTQGELGPGKPLSFCTNSGTCKQKVSPNEA